MAVKVNDGFKKTQLYELVKRFVFDVGSVLLRFLSTWRTRHCSEHDLDSRDSILRIKKTFLSFFS